MNKFNLQRKCSSYALLLAASLFFTSSDWSAVAQAAGIQQQETETGEQADSESFVVYEEPEDITKTEIKEERTLNSTTWQLSDGHLNLGK